MKRKVHWYLPAWGLTFLNEPESCTLQSALHRKAPICTSSMVTQESRWAFQVRTSTPPWTSSNSSSSWLTGGTDDIRLFVTLAAFLSLEEVFVLWAVSLATEIPSFNSCCVKTVWHIAIQDGMFFRGSSPVTQDTDEKQVATHGYSASALILNSELYY